MSSKLLVFLLICYATADKAEKEKELKSFKLFNWNWEDVHQVYVITTWLLVASLAKIIFNLIKPLSKWLPDSSLLIIVGLALGYVLRQTTLSGARLDSHAFFLYLLPPIIFDAGKKFENYQLLCMSQATGYFMPNRALFKNFDSVLVFSVIGTLWNTFAIGGSLLIMSQYDLFTMKFTTFEILVFSALISAVDPVAVIAVFEEIHVNEFLFINVFGEALFNDGVTVVLYQMFKSFALIGSDNLSPWDYATGGLSFFVVAMGGAAIGIIFAIVTSLATKYTQEIKILAPVFIFLLPYMAYLTAEMVSLSSIIAIAVCGMLMKQYIKGNITEAATNSVKYFTKMLSQCSETVIFMFLGLSTISSEHHVDVMFIAATLVFCLIYRAVGVVVQCYILNKFRAKKFELVDQFILSYGGLRGAIAYGLAVSIPSSIAAKPMFITTTIAVIYFTVFLQGITIRPLVNCLKVKRKEHRDATMVESVYNKYLDYMMSGVEDIAGQRGHYSFIENFERFNAKVIKPVLMRHETRQSFDATSIIRAYEKITLEDAIKLSKAKNTLQNQRLEKVKSMHQIAPEQQTVTPKDIQLARVMASGENIDQLYMLFSDLLDKKLGELKKQAERVEKPTEDDIQDDYMAQFGSQANIRSMTHSADQLASDSLFRRGGRRLSTGDLRANMRDGAKQKRSMYELRHV
ncbi:Protein CBR-NHX-3 [Caenorhabditis briggsae]|uniref:Sodium/hydrogen exchanger n=1 Tax=Caenorhabditis briggsae TaxID=6238 RepID=A8WNX5_CAEBR|nr:Protein CBR-NHX-3 [Caenorhabditis briggsae]CAP22181.2 Protein CBR-NHX-3 [Caenorhabditis briggsae]